VIKLADDLILNLNEDEFRIDRGIRPMYRLS